MAGDPEAAGEIILDHSNASEWVCIRRVGEGWEHVAVWRVTLVQAAWACRPCNRQGGVSPVQGPACGALFLGLLVLSVSALGTLRCF